MPKIRSNDAAIKGLEAKKGDMIKVIRKTKTAGTSEFYRVVI
jgi:DNA-directed RNA polymerase subunit H